MQIDTKQLVSAKPKSQPSVSKDFIKDKPKDKKSEETKILLKQASANKNATERKSDNKKPQLSEKESIAQPLNSRKKEGFLWRFFKKFLENLFGEDEMSLKDMKEVDQKSISNDEGQQKNQLVTSVNISKVKKTNTDRER